MTRFPVVLGLGVFASPIEVAGFGKRRLENARGENLLLFSRLLKRNGVCIVPRNGVNWGTLPEPQKVGICARHAKVGVWSLSGELAQRHDNARAHP